MRPALRAPLEDCAGSGSVFLLLCKPAPDGSHVDCTAADVLARVAGQLRKRDIRFAVTSVLGPVRNELGHSGINAALGPGAYYETPGHALEAFHQVTPPPA